MERRRDTEAEPDAASAPLSRIERARAAPAGAPETNRPSRQFLPAPDEDGHDPQLVARVSSSAERESSAQPSAPASPSRRGLLETRQGLNPCRSIYRTTGAWEVREGVCAGLAPPGGR